MEKRFDSLIDHRGAPLEGVSILVLNSGDAVATIYADDGVTTTPNPLSTDADGFFEYYAPDGVYSWVITFASSETKTIPGILHDDSSITDYWAIATGTGDAMIANIGGSTLANGFEFGVRAAGANTITVPQINVSGVGNKTIKGPAGAALAASAYVSGQELLLRYNLSGDYYEWLNVGDQIKDSLGSVSMFRTATNTFRVFKPTGEEVDITSSTTSGLQEAINTACSNGWDLHVYGGGIAGLAYPGTDVATIECTTSVTLPPCQLKNMFFGAVTLNFSLGGTSTPGLVFDSGMMLDFQFEGQVVYSGNGQAVQFHPINGVPGDNIVSMIDSKIRIKTIAYIGGGSDVSSACVGFKGGGGVGPIINCQLQFGEVNGANGATPYAKHGFYVENGLLEKCLIDVTRIHHVKNVGVQMGISAANTSGSNVWNIGAIQPTAAGSRGIDSFALNDYYNFSADNGAGNLDIGIILQANTTGCVAICRSAAGAATGVYSDISSAGTNTIISSGYVKVPQIRFPAPQVASSDPNVLDDYEEGGWTPQATFDTPGDVAFAGVTQTGRYVKIGKLVTIIGVFTGTVTHTTASGNLKITGIPFTIENISAMSPPGSLSWGGITKAGYTSMAIYGIENTSIASVMASGSGVARSAVTSANVPTGGVLDLVFCLSFLAGN